jgi:hypothetical protein
LHFEEFLSFLLVNKLFSAGLLVGSFILLSVAAAQAQSSTSIGGATANAMDPARMRRQQQGSPEDAARDQQLQILEARTGNTSFGAGNNGPIRQYDKSNGAFTVRKFKVMRGQKQKHGMSRQAPGINPKGKPLVHEHNRRKKFLFF